jgi:hypothetical protein
MMNNYGNWKSAANYLKAYTGGSCKMGDINDIFCTLSFNIVLLPLNKANYRHPIEGGLIVSEDSASVVPISIQVLKYVPSKILIMHCLCFQKG